MRCLPCGKSSYRRGCITGGARAGTQDHPHDNADAGVGTLAQLARNGQRRGIYAHGLAVIIYTFLNILPDVILSEFGLQDGLIDVAAKLGGCHFACFLFRLHFSFRNAEALLSFLI